MDSKTRAKKSFQMVIKHVPTTETCVHAYKTFVTYVLWDFYYTKSTIFLFIKNINFTNVKLQKDRFPSYTQL